MSHRIMEPFSTISCRRKCSQFHAWNNNTHPSLWFVVEVEVESPPCISIMTPTASPSWYFRDVKYIIMTPTSKCWVFKIKIEGSHFHYSMHRILTPFLNMHLNEERGHFSMDRIMTPFLILIRYLINFNNVHMLSHDWYRYLVYNWISYYFQQEMSCCINN